MEMTSRLAVSYRFRAKKVVAALESHAKDIETSLAHSRLDEIQTNG